MTTTTTSASWLGSLRSPRLRRGAAAMAIVLAAGGLILVRASGHTTFPPPAPPIGGQAQGVGTNIVSFHGSGAHGQIALSHTKVLAGGSSSIFAEVRLTADAAEPSAERAPLSLAVVLDTSGSMEGDKLVQAKRSVIEMVREMRDGDEIAMVRYASDHELVQPLARVGAVRDTLIARIRGLEAGGGTNIPGGLSVGLRALDAAEHGRVRRVVLVSDGLDSTRTEAERLASYVLGDYGRAALLAAGFGPPPPTVASAADASP